MFSFIHSFNKYVCKTYHVLFLRLVLREKIIMGEHHHNPHGAGSGTRQGDISMAVTQIHGSYM